MPTHRIFGLESELGIRPRAKSPDAYFYFAVKSPVLYERISSDDRRKVIKRWQDDPVIYDHQYVISTLPRYSTMYFDKKLYRGTRFNIPNGGSYSRDHDWLEYRTPEVSTVADFIHYSRAMDWLVLLGAQRLEALEDLETRIFRHARDFKQGTRGTHLSVQVIADLEKMHEDLYTFLATFSIINGAGIVSSVDLDTMDRDSVPWFQMSQRADLVNCSQSSRSSSQFPIFGMRAQEQSATHSSRLHISCLDPNMSDDVKFLTAGITLLMVELAETNILSRFNVDHDLCLVADEPVEMFKFVSRDTTLRAPYPPLGKTALEVQALYCELARSHFESGGFENYDQDEVELTIRAWEQTLQMLARDWRLAEHLDWVQKRVAMEGALDADGIDPIEVSHAAWDFAVSHTPVSSSAKRGNAMLYRLMRDDLLFHELTTETVMIPRACYFVSDIDPDSIHDAIGTPPATRAAVREHLRNQGYSVRSWHEVVDRAGMTYHLQPNITLEDLKESEIDIRPHREAKGFSPAPRIRL